MTNGLPPEVLNGLNVDGRDVVLSGLPDSEILSSRSRSVVAGLSGVRDVRTNVVDEMPPLAPAGGLQPATSTRQQAVQAKIDHLLDSQAIGFKADSAVLTPESETILDQVAKNLSEAPSLRCEIRGYGAGTSDARQNSVLPLRRALATEDYLIAKGIAEWRLSTQAFRSGQAAGSRSAESRRKDRVVDLVVEAR